MNKLVVLLGPTGVGKTDLSYSIAEQLGSPVLSADSRQMYRELRIGTAAPSAQQLASRQHYFIGNLSLNEYYSAARYESEVLALAERLYGEGHQALLLTGGSMMYIDAVCHGIDDIPTVDADTRAMLLDRYEREGLEPLVKELRLLDPEYYAIVDVKNPKRVLHALEICYMTGRTYTSFRTRSARPRPFSVIKIGLTRPREELYERINKRVDQMVADGLVEEARGLFERFSAEGPTLTMERIPNSLNTVGYKELFQAFRGECTMQEAIEKIKQDTRTYSRKQMTWFRRDDAIRWYHPSDAGSIHALIDEYLNEP